MMSPAEEAGTTGGIGDPALALVRLLWSRAWLIILVAFLFGLVAVAGSYLMTPQFRASTTLLPSANSGGGGLVAALGSFADLPMQSGQSVEELYPVIVKSDRVLDAVISRQYAFEGERKTLYEILGIGDDGNEALRSRRLKKHLRERVVNLERDKSNGVMRLHVQVPSDPQLAADLANTLTDSLRAFVEEYHGAKTKERLQYIQKRIDDVSSELHEAEAVLTSFLEQNRSYKTSPQLMLEAGRMERDVQALTAVWVELVRQLEISKIDDNKERYSVDVLNDAQPPLKKFKPKRASLGIIAFLLGGLLAAIAVVVLDLAGPKGMHSLFRKRTA